MCRSVKRIWRQNILFVFYKYIPYLKATMHSYKIFSYSFPNTDIYRVFRYNFAVFSTMFTEAFYIQNPASLPLPLNLSTPTFQFVFVALLSLRSTSNLRTSSLRAFKFFCVFLGPCNLYFGASRLW